MGHDSRRPDDDVLCFSKECADSRASILNNCRLNTSVPLTILLATPSLGIKEQMASVYTEKIISIKYSDRNTFFLDDCQEGRRAVAILVLGLVVILPNEKDRCR